MSRAGARSKAQPLPSTAQTLEPPPKPEVVQQYEQQLRDERAFLVWALCRTKVLERHLAPGEVKGAMIADSVMNQIAIAMAERQAKIIVPKPGLMVPR